MQAYAKTIHARNAEVNGLTWLLAGKLMVAKDAEYELDKNEACLENLPSEQSKLQDSIYRVQSKIRLLASGSPRITTFALRVRIIKANRYSYNWEICLFDRLFSPRIQCMR